MIDILTIRLPKGEKRQWELAAAKVGESVPEFIRKAVRQRCQAGVSPSWERHLGSADWAVLPPTNANVRAAMAKKCAGKP